MAKINQDLIKHIQGLKSNEFRVHVTPKAAANKIMLRKNANNQNEVRVYVTTPPEDGKANKAVIALLAKSLGVSKASINIVRGQSSRTKVIFISDICGLSVRS